MRFADVDCLSAQTVNDLEVLLKHVRVLVIFAGDIFPDGVGEDEAVGFAEGEKEDVAGVLLVCVLMKI